MKLSIIIPVYKVQRYLEHTINSILYQNYDDYEIILVDDASPDNCGEICDYFAENNERIITIHNPKNLGLSSARNVGLSKARGDWIWFVDSDDKVDFRSLETLSKVISPKYDVIFFGFQYVKENDDYSEKKKKMNIPQSNELVNNKNISDFILKYDSLHMFAPVWNKIYKKEFLYNNNITFENIRIEDVFFNCKVFANTDNVLVLDKCLYYYLRRKSGALSKSKELEKPDIYKKRYKEILNLLHKKNALTVKNRLKALKCYCVRLCYVVYVSLS
jgi:glycosyltransferase involved in cell wall biosynthesis